ncbi:MAG: RT0821/Lpp0805 family surface protein [Pseudomonadota bacterium]
MRTIAVLAAATLLSGCVTSGAGEVGANKTTFGGLLGGIGGAVAGAQFGKGKGRLVGVAAGTLLGALIGQEVGKSLDRADIAYANRAQSRAYAAPIGAQIAWSNPDSGNRGMLTPIREGRNQASGEVCREFHETIQVGGRTEQGYGIACRQADGSWRLAP